MDSLDGHLAVRASDRFDRERPEVEAFVQYLIDNETKIAESSQYVPLTDEQLTKAKSDFEAAVEEAGA